MTTLLPTDTVDRLRAELPAVSNANAPAYFNAGTLGPLPQPAIDAMHDERAYDEQLRQRPDLWTRLWDAQTDARTQLARLMRVPSEQVALMHSTHEGLNTLLWGAELERGDNIVTTNEEHPGLLVPLRHVRARRGCDVRIAGWADSDDAFVDNVLAHVDDHTKLVTLSHVSWMSGRIAPLLALRDALPHRVALVVDGAQSAGIIDTLSPSEWDAYTVSGQKWTCGPNGTGALVLADPERWQPTFGAYMQVTRWDDVLAAGVVDTAMRFEFSQESIAPLRGIATSCAWLLDRVGVANAHHHACALNALCRADLAELPMRGSAHLLVVDVPHGPDMAAGLADDGFSIRYLDDARIRISFGVWNTPDEVRALTAAIRARL